MTKSEKTARIILGTSAAAMIALFAGGLSAETAAAKGFQQQAAAQHLNVKPQGPGPLPPAGPKRLAGPRGGTAQAGEGYGCHDHAAQTSYEGPCDYYPQYESTGGCESEATQTSYPGNCQNSSEP